MSCRFVAGAAGLASHVSRRAGFHVPARRMTVSFGMRLETCSFHVGFLGGIVEKISYISVGEGQFGMRKTSE